MSTGFSRCRARRWRASQGGLVNAAKGIVGQLASVGLNAGKGLIDNLVNAIRNGIGAVGSAIAAVASKIANFLHHSVPDEGPLKDDDKWGAEMMMNIANGMQSKVNVLQAAARGVATTISASINTPNTSAIAANSALLAQGGQGGSVVIPVNLDGKQVAEYTLDLASKQLRQTGMTRYAR